LIIYIYIIYVKSIKNEVQLVAMVYNGLWLYILYIYCKKLIKNFVGTM